MKKRLLVMWPLVIFASAALGYVLNLHGSATTTPAPSRTETAAELASVKAAPRRLLWQASYTYSPNGIQFSLPIDGHEEPVIFDTGSNDFVIPQSIAGQLGLKPTGSATEQLANGSTINVQYTQITYKLGAMTVHARGEIIPATANGMPLFGFSSLILPGVQVHINTDTDRISFWT